MRDSSRRWWLTLTVAWVVLAVGCSQSSSGRAADAEAKLRALAATSDEPIYYLGPEFDGMPATPTVFDDASGTAVENPVSLGPGQSLSIGYGGICSGDTCRPVLEVATDPSSPFSGAVEGCARIAPLRGLPTATIAGAVVLFTADLAVTIHGVAEDLEKAKVAADALREVGQAGPTGVALPAPSAGVTPVVDRACGQKPGDHGKTTE